MPSCTVYRQMSSSVQFDKGNARILTLWPMRRLYTRWRNAGIAGNFYAVSMCSRWNGMHRG
jgi:hypothetical protein